MTAKRVGLGLVVVLLTINLVVVAKIYSEASTKSDKDNPYSQIELVTKVMELIRKEYVDGEKISYRDLSYGALKGMLSSLDPHSQFMEPTVYKEMQDDTGGKFGGLGIIISMSKEGFITVVSPMEDTPGARAGLLPGDRIIKIEGKSTEKMGLQEAVRELRGDPNTKVTITIFRSKAKEAQDKVKDYTLTREEIKVESVKDAKILQDGIGYVRITQFNEPTPKEFESALDKLEKQGLDALILDLRNNPGGLLDTARKISSRFIKAGELIVSTEGRDPTQKIVYRSDHGKKVTVPVVVLINNGSASASEIVAGALQDLKRAVIVGETSFGKGSVQSILSLKDGSAVRLTTAKYYTPSHKVIHEHGVVPDIVVPVSEEDERKLLEQRAKSNLPTEEGQEKVVPVADIQLERAIDVIKGVKLFDKQSKQAKQHTRPVAAETAKSEAAK